MGKVLIVDDEKSIRVTLKEFLLKEGIEAETASDGYEALQMFDQGFDVVVSDILMPKTSGIDLIENVREKSETIQIVIMTGEPTFDTAVKALKNGANDYLTKPVCRQDFIKSVRRAVQVKNLMDEKIRLELQNKTYQKNLEGLVEVRTNALQKAMNSIIVLLSTVVEVRDPYTAGHQRRVGNLSADIARKMGLDEKRVEYIRITGHIHDIGKIVVPGEILSKPGKLSSLEFEFIRRHSSVGHDMLMNVELPASIGETILQHHERCDGSGYPRGLKSDDILPDAKILMVADVVEAMMSHRPYRPALGLEAAMGEIRLNSGKLYDPCVVEACIELMGSDQYVIEDKSYTASIPILPS